MKSTAHNINKNCMKRRIMLGDIYNGMQQFNISVYNGMQQFNISVPITVVNGYSIFSKSGKI